MGQRYIAKRLPKQTGPAGWNRLLPPAEKRPELEDNRTADVAIIGGGFAGLSAARRLMQLDPTLSVAVFEAGQIAEGPAGRNSGFMVDLPHDLASEDYAGKGAESDRLESTLNRMAIAFAHSVSEEYDLPRHAVDPCGKINGAATPAGDAHNQSYARHLQSIGEDCTLLSADEMHERTGTRFYSSGLFTPGTTILQPAAYIRGLARGLDEIVSIYEHSPVIEFARLSDAWLVKTPRASVSAGKVILANNGHAESFGLFRRRLMHVFTYASMTEVFESGRLGGLPRWGITPADPMGTSVRRIEHDGGSRVLIRSRFTYNPSMKPGDSAIASAARLHDRKFRERFSMLDGVKMDLRWAGHLCLSWNGVPVHGEIEPGLFSAICQNGLGTTKGTIAGMSAAELVMGLQSELTQALTSAEAPKRLPPEPFATLGGKATLKWYEIRAGRE